MQIAPLPPYLILDEIETIDRSQRPLQTSPGGGRPPPLHFTPKIFPVYNHGEHEDKQFKTIYPSHSLHENSPTGIKRVGNHESEGDGAVNGATRKIYQPKDGYARSW